MQNFALLDEVGLSLPEVALRWVLSSNQIACTLTGSRSTAEVDANLDAAERGPLPADLLARIDEIAAEVPFRPSEEPAVLPLVRQYQGLGPVMG